MLSQEVAELGIFEEKHSSEGQSDFLMLLVTDGKRDLLDADELFSHVASLVNQPVLKTLIFLQGCLNEIGNDVCEWRSN